MALSCNSPRYKFIYIDLLRFTRSRGHTVGRHEGTKINCEHDPDGMRALVDQDPVMFRCEHWSRIRICFGGGHLWAGIRIWMGFWTLVGPDP